MARRSTFCDLLLSFCFLSPLVFADDIRQNSVGRNFVLAIPRNYDGINMDPYLTINNANPAAVTVTVQSACIITGGSTVVNIGAGSDYILHLAEECQVANHSAAGGLQENLGIQVTATNDISIVASVESNKGNTGDSFLVLPVSVLGDEYYAITSVSNDNDYDAYMNAFTVVAGTADTHVIIYGNDSVIDVVQMRALDTYTYSSSFDLTGYSIKADQPVAVISGCRCADTGLVGACDMVAIMLLPVNSWGTEFPIAAMTPDAQGDYLLVVSAQANTVITYNGNALNDAIGAGEFLMIPVPTASVGYLTTSQPVSVVQIIQGDGGGVGDPGFVHVPSIAAQSSYALFSTAGLYVEPDEGTWSHYLNIITATSMTANVLLDGSTIADEWIPIPNSQQQTVHIQLQPGQHRITTTGSATFSAVVYGQAYYVSYAFAASMSLLQNPMDACLSNPCQNAGTCVISGNTYTCECDVTHWGKQCQNDNKCLSNPCLNGGYCINDPGGYFCACLPDFTGPDCQFAITTVGPTQQSTTSIATQTTTFTTTLGPQSTTSTAAPTTSTQQQTTTTTQASTTQTAATTRGTQPVTVPSSTQRQIITTSEANIETTSTSAATTTSERFETSKTSTFPSTSPTPKSSASTTGGTVATTTSAQPQTASTAHQQTTVHPSTKSPGNYSTCATMSCVGLTNGDYNDPKNLCTPYFFKCSNGYCYQFACPIDIYGQPLYFDKNRDMCLEKWDVTTC